MMMQQRAHVTLCTCLGLTGYNAISLNRWKHNLADRWDSLTEGVSIAIIGKYTGLADAYLSVIKALQHACLAVRRRLMLHWVEADHIEEGVRCARGLRLQMGCRCSCSCHEHAKAAAVQRRAARGAAATCLSRAGTKLLCTAGCEQHPPELRRSVTGFCASLLVASMTGIRQRAHRAFWAACCALRLHGAF
jgi:hypothetical protein